MSSKKIVLEPDTTLSFGSDESGGFLTKVYGLVALGLLLSTTAAIVLIKDDDLMMTLIIEEKWFTALVFADLALLAILGAVAKKVKPLMGLFFLASFALLNGLTLSAGMLRYSPSSIFQTLAVATSIFSCAALYNFLKKQPAHGWPLVIVAGAAGAISATALNVITALHWVDWTLTFSGAAYCTLITAINVERVTSIGKEIAFQKGIPLAKAAPSGALIHTIDLFNPIPTLIWTIKLNRN